MLAFSISARCICGLLAAGRLDFNLIRLTIRVGVIVLVSVFRCLQICIMKREEENDSKSGTEENKYAMRAERQVADHEVEVVRHPVKTSSKNDRENCSPPGVYRRRLKLPLDP